MWDFLRTTPAQAVIWTSAGLLFAAIGFYIVQRFRNRGGDNGPSANELLTKFRRLHDQGELDPGEFRKIKSVLGNQLENELGDTEETV